MTYDSAQALSERYGPAYRWLVTVTGMLGVLSMVLAMTTVNVAVPDVMGAFGIGQDKAQWMSSAYMATMTAGMLLNAWMAGVLGEPLLAVADELLLPPELVMAPWPSNCCSTGTIFSASAWSSQ